MWRIPAPLMAGGASLNLTISVDTFCGNLWEFMGSPTGPQSVVITVDGADFGRVEITADWWGGSTFSFVCINGGRIVGEGGRGGTGALSLGGQGTGGGMGTAGGDALACDGFIVNVDVDDGFLCGGGGGGGGGSYTNFDTSFGEAGGGGGGGAGFINLATEDFTYDDLVALNVSANLGLSDELLDTILALNPVRYFGAGGGPGNGQNPPNAEFGTDGTKYDMGLGGAGSTARFDPNPTSHGGNGGALGSGGQTGRSSYAFGNYATTWNRELYGRYLAGGVGGRAGNAFRPTNGASIVYTGSKSAATLRGEDRLRGEDTDNWITTLGSNKQVRLVGPTEPSTYESSITISSTNAGFIFGLNGNLTSGDLAGSPAVSTTRWLSNTDPTTAALYDIRERALDGDRPRITDPVPVVPWAVGVGTSPGNWASLSADRTQSFVPTTGVQVAFTMLEIRRSDATGPDSDIIASVWAYAIDS